MHLPLPVLLALLAPSVFNGVAQVQGKLPPLRVVAPDQPRSQPTYADGEVESLSPGSSPIRVEWDELCRRYPAALAEIGFPDKGVLQGSGGLVIDKPLFTAMSIATRDPKELFRKMFDVFSSYVRRDPNIEPTATQACGFQQIDSVHLATQVAEAVDGLPAKECGLLERLLNCPDLYSAAWNPKHRDQRYGVLTSKSPIRIGGGNYYVGMTLIWADLRTIRQEEKEVVHQLSDVGQGFTDIWPVKGGYSVGTKPGGPPFRSLETYFRQVTEKGEDDMAYCSVLVESFERGYSVSDYFLNSHDFKGLYDLSTMHGRDILVPFGPVIEGRQVGYIVVSFVEWSYSIA